MRAYGFWLTIALGACLLGAAPAWVPSEGIGAVHMPVSCSAEQKEFDRGLALLHSFWYERSRAVFDDIIGTAPQCRIAYWGAAMTLNHPLWSPPSSRDRQSALGYIARGKSASLFTPREQQYFQAVGTLFGDGDPAGKPQRDTAYMNEMAQLHAAYPDDETTLFYALAVEGAPGYRTSAQRIERAGSLLAAVRAHQPGHPGALHYTIHAYDEFGYEQRGLDAALRYAASAPSIPHALHMPSHTFLALGLWDRSNRTNRRAFAASEQSVRAAREQDYNRDFHTLWFLIYGDLQAGNIQEARRYAQVALAQYKTVLKLYPTMPREQADDTFDIHELATSLTTYGFETGDYGMAAAVMPTGLDGAWRASQMEAAALRALSARNLTEAKRIGDELRLYDQNFTGRPAAKIYLKIAEAEVAGQYALTRGDRTTGLASLQAAADAEDQLVATGLGVQQPIYVPPAHEMYGLALLREHRYADAERALSAALKLTPKRPKVLAGLRQARARR